MLCHVAVCFRLKNDTSAGPETSADCSYAVNDISILTWPSSHQMKGKPVDSIWSLVVYHRSFRITACKKKKESAEQNRPSETESNGLLGAECAS